MDPQTLGYLEDSYNDMLDEFYNRLAERTKEMIRVENSENEDDKIKFIIHNLKQAEAQSGFNYDEDLSASYEDGLEIFDQVYQKNIKEY